VNRKLRVELLAAHHDRAAFACGEAALDRYIREQATQDMRRRVAQVFVALGEEGEIAGYYSLGAASFQRDDLPEKLAKKLPRYPVPAAILGRLAVASVWRGRGFGTFLLIDALDRVVGASAAMAVHAVIVDAKTDDAVRFYRQFGFMPFPALSRRLFLPLETFLNARG
jgi:GNAT superfamily N-acetyltransferase